MMALNQPKKKIMKPYSCDWYINLVGLIPSYDPLLMEVLRVSPLVTTLMRFFQTCIRVIQHVGCYKSSRDSIKLWCSKL